MCTYIKVCGDGQNELIDHDEWQRINALFQKDWKYLNKMSAREKMHEKMHYFSIPKRDCILKKGSSQDWETWEYVWRKLKG